MRVPDLNSKNKWQRKEEKKRGEAKRKIKTTKEKEVIEEKYIALSSVERRVS